ncbi:hypothetical protein, partial [uncultured Bacteroides sp.]|uniref:hypothetical protein n=1 Tax=uncultured Bacteroides sp. TaxID=162156 RepID=UPI002626FF3B
MRCYLANIKNGSGCKKTVFDFRYSKSSTRENGIMKIFQHRIVSSNILDEVACFYGYFIICGYYQLANGSNRWYF